MVTGSKGMHFDHPEAELLEGRTLERPWLNVTGLRRRQKGIQ